MSLISFNLPNIEDKIFLHAIDQQFENEDDNKNLVNNYDSDTDSWEKSIILNDVDDNLNVKFIMSLDYEDNFDDLSTEECSESEDIICTEGNKVENNQTKTKFCDLLKTSKLKLQDEIKFIKMQTILKFRQFQTEIQNKMQNNMIMMKMYYQNLQKVVK